jgi:hypothetical protein
MKDILETIIILTLISGVVLSAYAVFNGTIEPRVVVVTPTHHHQDTHPHDGG